MALSQKLLLRQSQTLAMTPQLMQAIKLLQLSNLDLVAYVEEELERNPLLERGSDDEAGAPEPAAAEAVAAPTEPGENWPETGDRVPEELGSRSGADLSNVFPDDPTAAPATPSGPARDPWTETPSRQAASSEDYDLEDFVAEERTLAQHLQEQLGLAISDPGGRLVGLTLIDEIDAAGYMRADVAEIAARLSAPLSLVEETLAVIQGFDPAGIGARTLAECLAIQLKERDRFDPAMARLVENLDLVARRDHAALKRLCAVDDEDLSEMLAEIRRLNPRPGAGFGTGPLQAVVPDVIVRAAPDGSWLVELNSGTLPKVLINQSYYARVSRGPKRDGDKAYLADCLQTANWLVKSLDQRAKTILKVTSEIVRQQDAFLTQGVEHLRPLNLKAIAEAIGMHESTVSRVTSNKYVATPRGTFELKYFFTAAIASSAGGEAHSAEAVRHRIKALIDGESANDILSDDVIVAKLRGSGIDIARRTVAKYREAMRIASSVQRRREKSAGA
ncbi:MAG: RNA polymerase factor sigma-54 [Bauldia sp.]